MRPNRKGELSHDHEYREREQERADIGGNGTAFPGRRRAYLTIRLGPGLTNARRCAGDAAGLPGTGAAHPSARAGAPAAEGRSGEAEGGMKATKRKPTADWKLRTAYSSRRSCPPGEGRVI